MIEGAPDTPAVSGLVTGSILAFVEEQGGSSSGLTEGLAESPERLRQWHAWFPWETYLALEQRFGLAMAHLDEPYLELGRYVITKHRLGVASLVLRSLATPAQVYGIIPWILPRFLLSDATAEVRSPSQGVVVVDYHFPEPVDPTASFLEVIRGQLLMVPSLVGHPPAEVAITRHDRGVTRYEIRLTPPRKVGGEGAFAWAVRGIMRAGRRTRVLVDLGGELLRTNELLGQKLRELEEANAQLRSEARERQRAVAAVRASEARYRALAEAAEDIIVVLDDELRVQYVNPYGARLAGASAESLRGRSLREHLSDAQYHSMLKGVRQVIRTGRAARREGTFGEGESERTIEASYVPLGEGASSAGTVLCLARDVTVRRQAERAKELFDARLQHTQRMESLGVLVGGIAHDFNNLLTVVKGNAELAGKRLSEGHPVRGLLDPITQAARQGTELCRLMLAFAGRGTVRHRRVDLSDTVRGMESLLRASVPDTVTLGFVLGEDLPPLLGDRTQLRQLAMNLVVNGAEAVGGGAGQVTLETGVFAPRPEDLEEAVVLPASRLAPRYLYLEVTDTGCGMDAETRARAFDPFFTTKFPGRGLGLAAVLGIVHGHGGLLLLHSSPAQGTRIRVGLPEAGQADESPAADEGTDDTEWRAGSAGDAAPAGVPSFADWIGSRTLGPVLLVDDEREIRELGRAILEELGLEVLTAADGREAMACLRDGEARPAAAILDITMPNMDGEALLRALREKAPGLPVLLISGHDAQEVATRFGGLEPYAYLPKPFSIGALVGVLRGLLEAGRKAAGGRVG